MDYPDVLLYDVLGGVLAPFLFSGCTVYFCSPDIDPEEEERSAYALAQQAMAVEQTRTLAAREPARRLITTAAEQAEMLEAATVDHAWRLAAAEQVRRLLAAAEQAERLEAAAVAPVVKRELGYFPYSAVVEGGRGRASGERQLVCAICLEVFVPGATCSEVPACRHFYHRDCIETWMKNSNSTCPLCRALIVPGSERLSAAEDMV